MADYRFDRKLGDSELSKIIQADLPVRDASLSQDNFSRAEPPVTYSLPLRTLSSSSGS
jgi:hypothetical protein